MLVVTKSVYLMRITYKLEFF